VVAARAAQFQALPDDIDNVGAIEQVVDESLRDATGHATPIETRPRVRENRSARAVTYADAGYSE
jgi:hypothetical protein